MERHTNIVLRARTARVDEGAAQWSCHRPWLVWAVCTAKCGNYKKHGLAFVCLDPSQCLICQPVGQEFTNCLSESSPNETRGGNRISTAQAKPNDVEKEAKEKAETGFVEAKDKVLIQHCITCTNPLTG